ncbi:hypothetical protein BGZ93_006231 [Podila epicladia]|nr:hypothetical protein BGZ92_008927 [Podila epicladia]KAG0099731.1 hypothetical protein BGZ93_006231 [Podila epicladia]
MDSGNNHSRYNWTQQQSAIPQNPPHDPLSVLLNALAHVDPDYQQQQLHSAQDAHHNIPIQAGEQSTFNSGQQTLYLDTISTPFSHDHLEDQGPSETPGHPRPLAIKPLYKKRVIVPVAKPDGIIRRTRTPMEKQQWSSSRPGANFYDQSMASSSIEVADQQEQGPPPAKRSKVAKAAASITERKRHRKGSRPKRTPKEFKPPREPKPPRPPRQHKEPKPHKPRPPKAPPLPPAEYAPPALMAPPNRKLPIETLAKKQEYYRDKIMKMASRPMPPRELRALVEAELKEEEKSLRDIYSSLHKELLKLQLEEGVFLNMLRMAVAGGMELEISDFKKIKRQRRSDTSEAVLVRGQRETSAEPMTIPSDIVAQEQGDHDMMQVETREEGIQGQKRQERQLPILVQDEDEDEDDNQVAYEDDDAFGEDWISKPTVHLPAETYSVPGLPEMISNEGRPSSSAIPSMPNLRETDHEPGADTSLDELKKLIVARGKQRTLKESGNRENDMELDEDDLYTLEDDDEMLLELDDDGDDDLLQSLNRAGGSKVNDDLGHHINKDDSSGAESEDYSDEDDEEGEDVDEDEEDEDRAREALSRMLSQYGDSGV